MSEAPAAGEVAVSPPGAEPGLEAAAEALAGPSSGLLRGSLLSHFVARDLGEQLRHRTSAPPPPPPPPGSSSSSCRIPAVDPQALQALAALADQVGAQVDGLLRSVHGALQAMSALSVGCIHTYRDGVESLGEAVDTSIRSMYTLMARCEELDREMQPVPALARRIRDMKSALERLEGLCK